MSIDSKPLELSYVCKATALADFHRLNCGLWMNGFDAIIQAHDGQRIGVYLDMLLDQCCKIRADIFRFEGIEGRAPLGDILLVRVEEKIGVWEAIYRLVYDIPLVLYPIDGMLSVLQFNSKYQFVRLYETAIQQLARWFPAGPDEKLWFKAVKDMKSDEWNNYAHGREFELVKTAIELRLWKRVPTMLYMCLCRRTTSEMLSCRDYPGSPDAILPDSVMHSLIEAQTKILKKCASTTYGWWTTGKGPVAVCTSKDECGAVIRQQVDAMALGQLEIADALLHVSEQTYEGTMCGSCTAAEKEARMEGVAQMFKELPSYFGLMSWDRL